MAIAESTDGHAKLSIPINLVSPSATAPMASLVVATARRAAPAHKLFGHSGHQVVLQSLDISRPRVQVVGVADP